jgi:nitric oxide reductase large subunit
MNIIKWIDKRKHWWKVFVIIVAVSVAVVGYIGYQTYQYAPPLADFKTESGEVVFEGHAITDGQQVFFRYGLMEYGSFLGDGGMRGPDFSAEALHLTATWMNQFRDAQWQERVPDDGERASLVRTLVQEELKRNRLDASSNTVVVSNAQAEAFHRLKLYYGQKFGAGGELAGNEVFAPANYITDPQEISDLTAFFYWGGWMAAAERPGFDYSYTHNWPYDPLAGNTPTAGVMFWSVIGALALVLSIGVVFYYYGKMDREAVFEAQQAKTPPLATTKMVEKFEPTPTQRACYKFFAVAAVLFGVQVLAGLLTIGDFVGFFAYFGLDISGILPVTITRAWHVQISVLWIAICWFAATIWVLPLICRPEPKRQLAWINALFWMLIVVGAGTFIGIPLGVHGFFGEYWRWFGLQGWEFVELGRVFHYILYASFLVWFWITARGVWPVLRKKQSWSLPNWMVYSIAGIIFMFTASFVANPDTNFVIADFWRWCTIHMWVEAFFELFTTIIAAYFMYLMGFVSHMVAARVVYLAAVLFLGSGLIGISHNFYWNAKSIETVALGGVLSSLQIVPLVLLTVEAWKFRNMPGSAVDALKKKGGEQATFGLTEPFLFLIGVNFWNFFGAGVLGFMINLPIVNYFQHGTYLTVNHGHAALFGVYGNLAICTMLFCGRWIIGPERWNAQLLRRVFWSLNLGLMLMVAFDLFPVGLHQLMTSMQDGYAAARSQAYLDGTVFQTLTWLRGIGVALFVFGGVIPLIWFMVTRAIHLKPARPASEPFIAPPTILAMAGPVAEGVAELDADSETETPGED